MSSQRRPLNHAPTPVRRRVRAIVLGSAALALADILAAVSPAAAQAPPAVAEPAPEPPLAEPVQPVPSPPAQPPPTVAPPTVVPPPFTPPQSPPSPPGAEPVTPVSPVEIHGFASQGFMLTTGNDYIVPDTTRGSFQLSEVGVNVTREITGKLRFGVQAFAQNLGLGSNLNLKADWFYLDYHWKDWLGLRFGRLKIPFGLYNDVNDVDSARVPVLLPQSTYPLQGRSFLFAQTGFELYGFLRAGGAGALDYRLYVGTIFIDPSILVPAGSGVELALNVRYVAGGRLFWETPLAGLRVGASVLAIHLDVTAFAAGMAFPVKNRSVLAMGSAEYILGNLALNGEYARWYTDQDSALPTSNFSRTDERLYALAAYRVARWFQPAAYYALFFPDVDNRGGGSAFRQDDLALTLRFDVTRAWIVKLEAHYMVGTAGLTAPLSVGAPPADPAHRWGVFLLKTTGYF
jgi:hypothetical protein